MIKASEHHENSCETTGVRAPSVLDRYLRHEAPHTLRIAADNVEDPRLAAWLRENAASDHRTDETSAPPTRGFAALLRRAHDIAQDEGAYRILGLPLALATESATRTSGWAGDTTDIDEALLLLSPEQRGDVRQQADEFADLLHTALNELRGVTMRVAG